jgi:hypothetical protein
MTGTSANCTALTNSAPRPGHWNTVSVTIAKATTDPSCSPAIVTTGIMVLRSAWRNSITRSGMPRARAKRTKSERRTSSISARTRRMISVSWKKPSVSTGSTRDCRPDFVRSPVVHQPIATVSPRPNDGNQRSSTAKT